VASTVATEGVCKRGQFHPRITVIVRVGLGFIGVKNVIEKTHPCTWHNAKRVTA